MSGPGFWVVTDPEFGVRVWRGWDDYISLGLRDLEIYANVFKKGASHG